MKIVIAPDSFKGTLTQIEAANIMKQAILACLPNAHVVMKPMADGGEGTLDVLLSSSPKNETLSLLVTGSSGEKITTNIGILNTDTAIIEVAKVIGLPLVSKNRSDPYETTTYGLGEAIIYALDQGIRKFVVGLGGSATNDGGFAMLQALGARVLDQHGNNVSMYGRSLTEINSVDLSSLDTRLSDSTIQVVSDVINPLYGPTGATAIFGPQKGASAEQVRVLDQAMGKYAHITLTNNNVAGDLALVKGSGAAGGLGFAFLLIGGKLVSGATYISKAIHLEQELQNADLVLTGEGKSDATTVSGKAPGHVANIAKKSNIPCILISGTVTERQILDNFFTEVHTLVDQDVTELEAMENPQEVLYEKTRRIIKEKIT